MPRFQLPAAGILASSVFASLITFYLTRSREGKIQLPTSVDGSEEDLGPDPFDVTTPEDIIDGYPIQAEAFWRRVSVPLNNL